MSFVRPTLSELVSRARADVESRVGTGLAWLRHSVLDVLVRMHAGAMSALYGRLSFVADQIIPDTAAAEYLARWAGVWGVRRKGATAATATARFTGNNGAAIPAGTQLSRVDGATFVTAEEGTIALGIADVAIAAEANGTASSLSESDVLTLTSPLANVQSQVALVAGTLVAGTEDEADNALRARLLSRIQTPPKGGAKSDYEAWALQVAGVTRAWVYPGWMGAGTVGVTFTMDGREDIVPLSADIDAMEEHLDPLRPVTADVVVFAPTPVEQEFIIRLLPSTDAVKAAVEAELDDLFARDSVPGGTMRISRIREAISLAAGEVFHDLNFPEDDPVAGPGELLVRGEIEWAE